MSLTQFALLYYFDNLENDQREKGISHCCKYCTKKHLWEIPEVSSLKKNGCSVKEWKQMYVQCVAKGKRNVRAIESKMNMLIMSVNQYLLRSVFSVDRGSF